jgi:nitrile hydratase subunit beta
LNGPHDLGGVQGLGPVRAEPNEPPFHAEWERRAFALTLGIGATGQWTIDEARATRELTPEYLARSYYDIWLTALERLLQSRGLVSAAELAAGRSLDPPRPLERVLRSDDVAVTLGRGGPSTRPAPRAARFSVGDRVRARNMHPPTHTRLPRYVRGHAGTIERLHGCHVFPDSSARREGEDPQWLYTVRFDGRELWGPDADPTLVVSIDAFEPYLEPLDG